MGNRGNNFAIHRKRGKALGVPELIAIALGGMVGGVMTALAAYSYIKLGVYYKDEGATYSFYKKTFPDFPPH